MLSNNNNYSPFKDWGFIIVAILILWTTIIYLFTIFSKNIMEGFPLLPYLISFIFWGSFIYFKKGKKLSFLKGLFWSILIFTLVFFVSFKIYSDYKMEKSGMNDKISSLLTEFEKMKQEDDIDNFKEKDPTKSLIETANWKTYKNEKVRFEIKYPSNYRLELFEDITPYKETEEQIKVNSLNQNLPEEISNYDVLSIGAYGYNFFPEMKSSWSELKESIIGDKVGGYLVTEISGMKMLRLSPHYSPMGNIYNSYARFYNENGDVVDLWVELENENKEQKKNIIFNQILSTFKFTN